MVWYATRGRGGGKEVPATAPESFRFARNAWYSPDGRRPQLPAENEDATVGVGQPLVNPREDDRFNTAKSGPLSERGADAYRGDE